MIRLAVCLFFLCPLEVGFAAEPWQRHAVDNSLRGADGVRLADFNGDGLADIVTGWEESGVVRLYLNPGPAKVTQAWPGVTVGQTASPEDAVAMDIDRDGKLDVVSCHEGKARRLLVHFNDSEPLGNEGLLNPASWQTAEFETLRGQLWMFAAELELRGNRSAIVAGSKGKDATITLITAPLESPRDLSQWNTMRLRRAGWIMSLRVVDMDGDGDQDVVYSDRKGPLRCVGWLEQPDSVGDSSWNDHPIGGEDKEVMFIDVVAPVVKGAAPTILTSTRNSVWLRHVRDGKRWMVNESKNPPRVNHGKAIARMPDGELVMTSNTFSGVSKNEPGVWYRKGESPWQAISSSQGGKFDRIEVIDLNGDGAPDVLTCEERRNLGVIWYENPGGTP